MKRKSSNSWMEILTARARKNQNSRFWKIVMPLSIILTGVTGVAIMYGLILYTYIIAYSIGGLIGIV